VVGFSAAGAFVGAVASAGAIEVIDGIFGNVVGSSVAVGVIWATVGSVGVVLDASGSIVELLADVDVTVVVGTVVRPLSVNTVEDAILFVLEEAGACVMQNGVNGAISAVGGPIRFLAGVRYNQIDAINDSHSATAT
jgi:hypothetical protein